MGFNSGFKGLIGSWLDLTMGLGGLKKDLLSLPGIETLFLGRPARSLATTLTELFRLPSWQHRQICMRVRIKSRIVPTTIVMSVRLSVYPHKSGRIPTSTGDVYDNPSQNTKFAWNRTKISGTLHEDPGTFLPLAAVRNIWQLDNSAKGAICCISTAPLHAFVLLTATCTSTTIRRKGSVTFPW